MTSRTDKIIDWAFDPHKSLLNVFALALRIVIGLYCVAEDFIWVQRGINRGEIQESDDSI